MIVLRRPWVSIPDNPWALKLSTRFPRPTYCLVTTIDGGCFDLVAGTQIKSDYWTAPRQNFGPGLLQYRLVAQSTDLANYSSTDTDTKRSSGLILARRLALCGAGHYSQLRWLTASYIPALLVNGESDFTMRFIANTMNSRVVAVPVEVGQEFGLTFRLWDGGQKVFTNGAQILDETLNTSWAASTGARYYTSGSGAIGIPFGIFVGWMGTDIGHAAAAELSAAPLRLFEDRRIYVPQAAAASGSSITAAAGLAAASTLTGSATAESSITAAPGQAAASTLTGSATSGASVTAAAGLAAASTLTGSATAESSVTAAAGLAAASTLTGSAAGGSEAAIAPAAGAATASTLTGSATSESSITAAAGLAAASTLTGSATSGASITAAAGLAAASTLTGSATAAAAILAAAGAASGLILVGGSVGSAIVPAAGVAASSVVGGSAAAVASILAAAGVAATFPLQDANATEISVLQPYKAVYFWVRTA
jgi:hypothetical protein